MCLKYFKRRKPKGQYTIYMETGVIGITVECTSRGALVIWVPPQYRKTTGMMPGDVIISINGYNLVGMEKTIMTNLLIRLRHYGRVMQCVPRAYATG